MVELTKVKKDNATRRIKKAAMLRKGALITNYIEKKLSTFRPKLAVIKTQLYHSYKKALNTNRGFRNQLSFFFLIIRKKQI